MALRATRLVGTFVLFGDAIIAMAWRTPSFVSLMWAVLIRKPTSAVTRQAASAPLALHAPTLARLCLRPTSYIVAREARASFDQHNGAKRHLAAGFIPAESAVPQS